MKILSFQEASDGFSYDPETGHLWRKKQAGRGRTDIPAGTLMRQKGYRQVWISGKRYLAHRVAWLIHHGHWPELFIDHKNGVRDDNRIENLRLATREQNSQNYHRVKVGQSGVQGVHWCSRTQMWKAGIQVNKKTIHLGRYENIDQAKAAHMEAKRKYHEFAII